MPIDFPANPTNGQVYGNWIYDSSITSWRNVNTDTGIGTLNAMGLKNVVPTSVSVGSGTATVNGNGTVTFSGASSITINNVFSSTYSNYKVMIDGTLSIDTSLRLRLDNISTANYNWQWVRSYGTTTQPISGTADTAGFYIGSGDSAGYSAIVDVFNPNKAVKTNTVFNSFGSSGSDFVYNGSGQFDLTTQVTGITFLPSVAATLSGTITVYGLTS